MRPTPMLHATAASGFGDYFLIATTDAEAEGGVVCKVERARPPVWTGPVGRAILRQHLTHMREVWRAQASSWGCGRQDLFGDHMDAVEREIRDTGYTGPLD